MHRDIHERMCTIKVFRSHNIVLTGIYPVCHAHLQGVLTKNYVDKIAYTYKLKVGLSVSEFECTRLCAYCYFKIYLNTERTVFAFKKEMVM